MARGARRFRSHNAPRNDPHKYSMEQAASAGSQVMTLSFEAYELAVVRLGDRQEWILGMRQAIDLSSGGKVNEGKFEFEAKVARKEMEANYWRMQ